ncbi:pyridoxal phosphate-dependent aminotransferase [Thermonema rossianum]|uniref:pyridoxal phosphate-dependent aminotransferase n=1 Tax=Thermonema rossianum TaxID=55505 RepID=UPI00056F0779|nr:pyridoxal phosphate-dependent aminotransferase [Thermonema rossianum]
MSTLSFDKIQIAERVSRLSESATLQMAAKARELERQGVEVIKLSLGEPDFYTPDHIKEAAKKAIDDNFSFYTPVPAYLELREAIAEKLRKENALPAKAEQVVVTTGAKQALMNAILCLVNPGDEVVVFSPYWVSYLAMIELAEGKPVFLQGDINNQFKVSPAQLKAALTDKTKVVLYSSPSNPTGTVYSKEELRAFADVLQEYPNVVVISDEIYEYINFTGEYFSIGAFEDMHDRVVTVNGFSKGFAMTGWRVGYLHAPAPITKACIKLQGQFTSATCSIAQKAAYAAITGDRAPIQAMKEAFQRRRDLVLNLLKEIPGVGTYVPQGAFYIFPDVSSYFGKSYRGQTIANAEDLCMYLLNEAHVALVAGDAFGAPNCIRISFAASDESLTEALKRIKDKLAQLQ